MKKALILGPVQHRKMSLNTNSDKFLCNLQSPIYKLIDINEDEIDIDVKNEEKSIIIEPFMSFLSFNN